MVGFNSLGRDEREQVLRGLELRRRELEHHNPGGTPMIDTIKSLEDQLKVELAKHTFRLSKDDFLHVVAGAEITFSRGSPNPETRDGVYVRARRGISFRTFFVGVDLTTNEMIYERVD